jgi:excisionase family DNA binding protein
VTNLARHLLDELDEADMAELARRLAPYMPKPAPASRDGWLNSRQAAKYLGISLDTLQDLAARRQIPFEQRTTRGRLYFDPSALDNWRRGAPAGGSHAANRGATIIVSSHAVKRSTTRRQSR